MCVQNEPTSFFARVLSDQVTWPNYVSFLFFSARGQADLVQIIYVIYVQYNGPSLRSVKICTVAVFFFLLTHKACAVKEHTSVLNNFHFLKRTLHKTNKTVIFFISYTFYNAM